MYFEIIVVVVYSLLKIHFFVLKFFLRAQMISACAWQSKDVHYSFLHETRARSLFALMMCVYFVILYPARKLLTNQMRDDANVVRWPPNLPVFFSVKTLANFKIATALYFMHIKYVMYMCVCVCTICGLCVCVPVCRNDEATRKRRPNMNACHFGIFLKIRSHTLGWNISKNYVSLST